jgi:hypothetical protein
MRRYLNSQRPVPVGPYGHRVVEAGVWADGRACEVDQAHGVATHITQSREERGSRRSSIHTMEQFVCEACARAFAAKYGVAL